MARRSQEFGGYRHGWSTARRASRTASAPPPRSVRRSRSSHRWAHRAGGPSWGVV